MNEFVEQFLVEARELVEQATSDLLALEVSPSDRESLDGAFRAFHTLKGGAGIVDFAAMARAMHAAEDVLDKFRSGSGVATPMLIGECLSCLDRTVEWLDTIQETGEFPADADVEATRIVESFQMRAQSGTTAKTDFDIVPAVTIAHSTGLSASILDEQLRVLSTHDPWTEGRAASVGRLASNVFRYLRRFDAAAEIELASARSLLTTDSASLIEAIKRGLSGLAAPERPVDAADPSIVRHDPLSRTLRVDAARIAALVNIASELTVAKNSVEHVSKSAEQNKNVLAGALKQEAERLNRLIGTLQRAVLELRVLPLRGVFQRFSRLLREMSTALKKPVRLTIEGEDTEVDKTIVEMLFEPLLHVVRNAMDHGIEEGGDRAASGKPTIANIHLRARREGDHVVVEVQDDGRGIDPTRVRELSIEKGLVSQENAATMSEEELIDLIFLPGFSTAGEITSLSGRGVGMDVVRNSLEKIGGRVFVQSQHGSGALVRFVLPFSVMMSRVLTVEAGGQMFGIPLDVVVETLRIGREDIFQVGRTRAFISRERTVPLAELGLLLGGPAMETPGEAIVVITSIGGQLGAFEVARLGERIDVMLKPPDGLLHGIREIAGTTMVGDGTILLVLDIKEVFH